MSIPTLKSIVEDSLINHDKWWTVTFRHGRGAGKVGGTTSPQGITYHNFVVKAKTREEAKSKVEKYGKDKIMRSGTAYNFRSQPHSTIEKAKAEFNGKVDRVLDEESTTGGVAGFSSKNAWGRGGDFDDEDTTVRKNLMPEAQQALYPVGPSQPGVKMTAKEYFRRQDEKEKAEKAKQNKTKSKPTNESTEPKVYSGSNGGKTKPFQIHEAGIFQCGFDTIEDCARYWKKRIEPEMKRAASRYTGAYYYVVDNHNHVLWGLGRNDLKFKHALDSIKESVVDESAAMLDPNVKDLIARYKNARNRGKKAEMQHWENQIYNVMFHKLGKLGKERVQKLMQEK